MHILCNFHNKDAKNVSGKLQNTNSLRSNRLQCLSEAMPLLVAMPYMSWSPEYTYKYTNSTIFTSFH